MGSLHDECSSERLASMAELFESMGEPLSLSRTLHLADEPTRARLEGESNPTPFPARGAKARRRRGPTLSIFR